PDFGLAWTGPGHAAVWYWSHARIAGLLAGGKPRRIEFVPEALYVGAAREDGAELLALAHGVEGRVWRQGRLVASRWWPAQPDPGAWRTFLRSAGAATAADDPMPAPLSAPIAVRRWSADARRAGKGSPLAGLTSYAPQAALVVGLALL